MTKKPKRYCVRESSSKRVGVSKSKRYYCRESSSKRGYDNQWRKLRNSHIHKYPLCQTCLNKGITKSAREVDHIVPFANSSRIDHTLRLDPNNLQSLCRRCHAIKTQTERRVKNRSG